MKAGLLACTLLLFASSASAQAASQEEAPFEPETTPDPPPTVRASFGEGFRIVSADGRMSLRVGALVSARADLAAPSDDEVAAGAWIRLARPVLSGELLGPTLTYFVQGELAGTPGLLDADITYRPFGPELRIRAGRLRVPLSRQWITGNGVLALPDRSLVTELFKPGRDTGITLEGDLAHGLFEYHVGGYGEGRDRHPAVVARAAVHPFGPLPYDEHANREPGPARIAVGAGLSYDRFTPTEQRIDPDTLQSVTVELPDRERLVGAFDVALRAGPALLLAEAYLDRREASGAPTRRGYGVFVQAGIFVLPPHLELLARANAIGVDAGHAPDGLRRYEAGLAAHFFGSALVLQARYLFDDVVGAPMPLAVQEGHTADLQFVLVL